MMRTMRRNTARAWWRGALLAGTVVVAALGLVQAQQQAPATEPAASDQTDPTALFRSGVTLVTTDVIVRDRDGVFLPDLTEHDFTIFEDDAPRDVASLVLVHGGRVFNQLLPPPPSQEGIILPPTRAVNDTAGRIFLIVIDDLHIEANKTPKTRQVFQKMADTLIHEGDMFGIVATGPSSIRYDMSYDRTLLTSAMERIVGDGFNADELINEVSEGTRGPEELRWRAHVAFKTVHELVRNLERIQNRRKVVIYFSSGYDFNPFEYQRSQARGSLEGQIDESLRRGTVDPLLAPYVNELVINPFDRLERQAVVFSDTDLQMELAELAQAANRANASFYTVDPRGLLVGPDVDYNGPVQPFQEWLFTTQSSLRALAELTGGKAIVNSNNFEGLFKEIDAETSDYYVLGFYSGNADPTARTRRLRVEVDREDVEIQSRTHYTYARSNVAQPPRP